jgi:hypothetical protein
MNLSSPHTFHIPVMGLAYTIDTPVKVAHYGINSVVSIIEDNLIERMRKYYYDKINEHYNPITNKNHDYRAKRITDYLNLLNAIVNRQTDIVRNAPFEPRSEITKYFDMLPDGPLKSVYKRMVESTNPIEKIELQKYLRHHVRPGRIDVNIMTKVDKNNLDDEGNLLDDGSDAVTALRGYCNSDLTNSAIIFSAGLNPRLFNYLEKVDVFKATAPGQFNKEIIIKVSDYRSALIQGKYLAKKGLWVSEFRIESGLNCGGHAFATDGSLLGPILDEFRRKKSELINSLYTLYQPAITMKGQQIFSEPHPIRITVQGGIGTNEEAAFLTSEYEIDGTGWGTPFLLCPEATTVDNETLSLLKQANEKNIVLSRSSPLGVRFNYLKGTSAERERDTRIKKGKPGSPCTEKYLVSNTEFTKEPICTASHAYQKRKIAQLKSLNLSAIEYQKQYDEVTGKECLCIGLSNAAFINYHLPPIKNMTAVTICPGPNIAYFDREFSLQEIIDHIYGRGSVLAHNERPHMFVKELVLNFSYLQEQVKEVQAKTDKAMKEFVAFGNNLLSGIVYYKTIAERMYSESKTVFLKQLNETEGSILKFMKELQLTINRAAN